MLPLTLTNELVNNIRKQEAFAYMKEWQIY